MCLVEYWGRHKQFIEKLKPNLLKIIFLYPKCMRYWTNTKIVMCQISRIYLQFQMESSLKTISLVAYLNQLKHFFLIFEELNLAKYVGICFYCIYSPYSDFLKPAVGAEGSFFLKTSKLTGDLIQCFELGNYPVTQLALTQPGSPAPGASLCHLLALI